AGGGGRGAARPGRCGVEHECGGGAAAAARSPRVGVDRPDPRVPAGGRRSVHDARGAAAPAAQVRPGRWHEDYPGANGQISGTRNVAPSTNSGSNGRPSFQQAPNRSATSSATISVAAVRTAAGTAAA